MSTIDEIQALNSSYLNTVNGSKNTGSLETTLNSNLTQATEEELLEVCKEFEAYFTEQVFKQMNKMVPESDESSSSMSGLKDYYKDELIQEYASMSTENGGIGLAQTLYEQMKRNYNLKE